MLRVIWTVCLGMMGFHVMAQQRPAPDTIPAVIHVDQQENKAAVKAELRPLRQIAGAPEAFYSYYWEFGDGTFSFAAQPEHHYKDTGTYDIRIYATNNYDDGKAPKGKPRRIKVKKTMYAATEQPSSFFPTSDMLAMKINRMPKPGEEMVTIVGYRNPSTVGNMSGSLLLFYNEKQFSRKNFALQEERAYNGERPFKVDSALAMAPSDELYVPLAGGPSAMPWIDPLRKSSITALLAEKKSLFREQHAWRVENLKAGEEKFLFLSLETTPEMIKDTNAVVTISSMFIPDDSMKPLAQYNLEMQVVASHDPNRMQLRNRRMNYRFVSKQREMSYKVQFQNTGKGPASRVAIGIAVPDMLNGQSLEITDYSPGCLLCDSAYERQSCLDTIVRQDSIFFVFNNIYLKGMQQEGVQDPDSTKGFVKYKIRFGEGKLKKLPFTSQASIVFDKNEPVITNRSRGGFRPGLSPGVIVGYGKGFAKQELPLGIPAGTLGFTISAYSPYKPYFQAELYLGIPQRTETLISTSRDQRDTSIGQGKYIVIGRELHERVSRLSMDVVPVHIRYNVKSWLGAGAGMMASVLVSEKAEERKLVMARPVPDGPAQQFETLEPGRSNSFTSWDGALFADVNLGMVRAGPSLGVRLIQYFKEPQQRLFIYGIWRF